MTRLLVQLLIWPFLGSLALGTVATPSHARASEGFGDLAIIRARDAFRRGDDAEALALLSDALAQPRTGNMWLEARFLAAECALRLGRAPEVLVLTRDLSEALPLVEDFVLAMRARALRLLGRWQEARVIWQNLVGNFPRSPLLPEASFSIADSYLAEASRTLAEQAYAQAVKTFPRHQRAAVARYNLGRLAEARKAYDVATSIYVYLTLNPRTLDMSGHAEERLEAMRARGVSPPQTFADRLDHVDRLLRLAAFDAAAVVLNGLAESAPSQDAQRSVMYRQAQLAYRTRDLDRAERLFSALAASSSGWTRGRYEKWLARTYSAANRFDEAVAIYVDLAARFGDMPAGSSLLYLAAWLSYDGQDYTRAITLFDTFLSRYGNDRHASEALWYKAWSAYHAGDLALAGDTLTALRTRFPRSALVQRTYYWEGRLMSQMGRADDAIAAFERAATGEVNYYSVLAQQRLADLDEDLSPHQWAGGISLASLEVPRPLLLRQGEQPNEKPVPTTTIRAGAGRTTPIPWGQNALNWQHPLGQRAQQLIDLGHTEEAAALVRKLPARAGFSTAEIAYARARMLYALDDFTGAYRIVAVVFRKRLHELPNRDNLRYFQLAYPLAYWRDVSAAAQGQGLSEWLLLSIIRQESAFDPNARSWANAWGLMQVIPPTGQRIAESLGHPDYTNSILQDPAVSVRFGAWYLGQLWQKFRGNIALAVGSYNAGPRAMERWVDARAATRVTDEFVEDISYRETRHYVKRVLTNYAVYGVLYGNEPLTLPDDVPNTYRDNVDF